MGSVPDAGTDSSWYAVLTPLNPQTQNRLYAFGDQIWITNRAGSAWMFEWFDPRDGGNCGNEHDYVAHLTASRFDEMHAPDPSTPPSGKETHCIQPGNYHLEIVHEGVTTKEFDIDYVPGMPGVIVVNSSAGVQEAVESENYDDTLFQVRDVVVNVQVGDSQYTHTAVLQVDSAGASPYSSTTFSDQNPLRGDQYTWFRFSAAASSTSANFSRGKLLARLYWDAAHDRLKRTGFWDTWSGGSIMRIHQFTDTTQTDSLFVGLEVMPPDRQPQSAPDTMRQVFITVTHEPPPPPPPPPALSNQILGPDLISASGTYVWTDSAAGGQPPYSYGSWYFYRYPRPDSLVTTGSSYSRYISTSTEYVFRLRAYVSDSTNTSVQARFFVDVMAGGRAPSGGVRLEDGSCGFRPPAGASRQRWLEWVFDYHGGVVEYCRLGR